MDVQLCCLQGSWGGWPSALMEGGGGCLWLLARAWPPPRVSTQADGTGWPRVEAGGQRGGWADERRGLLQHGPGLQEAGLLLEGRGLAV